VTNVKYLDTGKIKDVKKVYRYGLETAWVNGPFSLQGEWVQSSLTREDEEDLDFNGWYTQLSWFVTEESRQYKPQNGKFGRIHPLNDYGAFELAARMSSLDLNDEEIFGGNAKQYTLGLNWYLNSYIRFMFNYVHVDNDEYADADGDVIGNDDPDIYQLRMQANF